MKPTISFRGKPIAINEMPLGKLREVKKFVEESALAKFQPLVSDEEYESAKRDWKKFLEMALEQYDPAFELDNITIAEMGEMQLNFFAYGMQNLTRS